MLLRRWRHLVNKRKAPGKAFGSTLDSPLGGAFGKHLGSWAVAGVVLMTGAGVLVAFSALAAKPERLRSLEASSPESLSAAPVGIPLCHSSAGAAARTGAMIRLAASRTEVPNAEIQATAPNAAFADIDPPLWE